MAGLTLAPAAFYVTGYVAHNLDPANPRSALHADSPARVVSVSSAYHQGTATYNPHLGQPVPTHSGGSIDPRVISI
jgi:hypothetical protein